MEAFLLVIVRIAPSAVSVTSTGVSFNTYPAGGVISFKINLPAATSSSVKTGD